MISKKEVLQCSGNLQACSTHITAVIVDKKLFVWGRFGGINTLDVLQDCKCCEIPLPSNTVAMSVSCGYTHILVLTNQGVCSLGSNKYGELGLGNTKSSQVPRVISRLKDERIVQVDCGHYHNLALSEHGRVYTWGWGAYGQLGQGHIDDMNIPTEVTALKCEFVVSVSAGHAHSMVLTRQGVVCVFGNNAFGQLGLGGCMKRSTPTKLQLNAPVSSISTQYFHCVAVTDKEEIYEWGVSPVGLKQKITVAKKKKSGKGTKTEPSDRADHLTPKMVNRGSLGLDVQIVQVSCGVDFSMALTSSGKVYGWGRNLDGQLGIGKRHTKTETRLAPVVQMNSLSIQQLACGPDFVVAMDTQGETWGWGRNDYGQLSLLMTDPTGMLSQSFVFPVQISTVPSAKPPAQGNQWDVIPLSIDRANLHKLADYNNQMEGQVLPLHAYLQCLSPFINLHLVLCKAIQLENYPCAAQICDLNQRYGDAFMYRLKGLNSANTLLKEQVCHIISECLGKLKGSKRKLDIYHTVLQQLFDWWATQRECLSVADLENILTPYLLDLAVIIFTIISRMELTGSNTIRFSPPFTMQMTNYILTKLKHGHNNQIINKLKNEALSSTASNPWKPSFGGEKIWWEIVENRKDSKAVELSGKVIKQIQCDMNFETTVKSGELIDEIVNDDSDVEAKEDVESGKLNQHFEPVEPENWKNKDKLIFDYTEGFDNQGDIISGQLESPTSREKTNAKQIFISSLDNDDTVNEGCSDSSSVQNKYEQYPEMKDSAILDSEDLIPEVLSTSLNSKKEDKSIEAVIVFSCGHTLTKSVFTLDIEKHSENRDIMFSYYTRTGVNTLVCPQCLLCAIETVI